MPNVPLTRKPSGSMVAQTAARTTHWRSARGAIGGSTIGYTYGGAAVLPSPPTATLLDTEVLALPGLVLMDGHVGLDISAVVSADARVIGCRVWALDRIVLEKEDPGAPEMYDLTLIGVIEATGCARQVDDGDATKGVICDTITWQPSYTGPIDSIMQTWQLLFGNEVQVYSPVDNASRAQVMIPDINNTFGLVFDISNTDAQIAATGTPTAAPGRVLYRLRV